MQARVISIAAALALAFSTAALAQSAEREEKKAEHDRIEADYKAAKAKCSVMKGNEKDVCEADAKGKENVAKAELDAKYNNTPRAQRKVDEAKADHEYQVAKE